MKVIKYILLLFIFFIARVASHAQTVTQDTALTGIYITSIHDIDFKQKEYTVNLWLWMKYKRRDIDFVQNLEVPQAKTVNKAFSTIDSSSGKYFLTMKLQCVMKDNWKTDNFPFDRQYLRLSFENSQFDSSALVFAVDSAGDNYDKKFALRGWDIDSCVVSVKSKLYNTAFGVEQAKPQSTYSSYRIRLVLKRESMGIFWKLFLGMYVAFLISFVCFFIHPENFDSRFGLSVGALFAVVGNKYVVDSSLPETTTFTLVDKLHDVTLVFILFVIAATAYSLKLYQGKKIAEVENFDSRSAKIFFVAYILINAYFIWHAVACK